MHQHLTAFENIVGKGEIAHNEQFLLFPQCFLLGQIIVSPIVHIFDIISLFAAELEEPKIGMWGKGLTFYHTVPLKNKPFWKKLGEKVCSSTMYVHLVNVRLL